MKIERTKDFSLWNLSERFFIIQSLKMTDRLVVLSGINLHVILKNREKHEYFLSNGFRKDSKSFQAMNIHFLLIYLI